MRKFPISLLSILLILGAILVTISGCYKDFEMDDMREDFITWEPDIAFPIVFSNMGAEQIISLADTTNIYHYDENDFITLIYRRRIFSQTVNDFFQLPSNQVVNSNMMLSPTEIATFVSTGTVQTTLNTGMTVGLTGPGGSQLDKMRFFSGIMNISFTSNFEHSGNLVVSMPEMRLNGAPFSQTYAINYTGGAVTVSIDVPLAGYEMDLDNGGPPNSIPIDYTLTLNNGGGAIPTPVNQVQINHAFEDPRMAFADGDFGQFDLEIGPSEVDLDVLQSEHTGQLYFEDPKLRINIRNTIGAEIDVDIIELYATGDLGQTDIDLSSLIPGNQFTIPPAPSVGDTAALEYLFTQNNSNVKELVNLQYDQIRHDFDAEVNPNGPAYNFATLNSAVEVTADVELPFWGFGDHVTIVDTVEVPFSDAEEFADNIEKGLLRINTLSHFPVDARLKLYFADSLYNVTDSVLTDGSYIIESGLVEETIPFDGNTFRVVQPTHANNDIPLDTARIANLFRSQYLFLTSEFTTTNDAGHNIKLFTDDFIEVRIGLRVKLKASPSDLDDI